MDSTRTATAAMPMPGTREEALDTFGHEVVGAMDELAELVFASRLLAQAAASGRARASSQVTAPLAAKIERSLRAVAADLLEAVQRDARENLAERLKQVRKANVLRLAQAGMDASALAAQRGEAVDEAEAEFEADTDVMRASASPMLAVQRRIERVAARWATL
jgi:hypothetical protein